MAPPYFSTIPRQGASNAPRERIQRTFTPPLRPPDHVFVSKCGTALNRYAVYKRFKGMSRLAGVQISPRLRRTFATHTNNRGVPPDKIQLALGHSDIKTTWDYIQTSPAEVAQEMRGW